MRICLPGAWLLLLTLPVAGAELNLSWGEYLAGQSPTNFRSSLMGKGKPGEWKIVLDEEAPLLPPLSPNAPKVTKRAVLAQLGQDPADEHFPMLVYQGETFGDFTLTTRFKTVKGAVEQMAGIAFRLQDETNYYVVRASSLGNTFRFYKVLNGERGPLVGPEIPIPGGTWHDLTIECKGSAVRCLLDGKEQISVNDRANALASGRIAFWTKSDSVCYFGDTKIVYRPFEPPAQKLVRALAAKYPRLLGLKVYVPGDPPGTTRMIASSNESERTGAGGKSEAAVIGKGETYYGKEKGSVSVIMPLRDRNGEPIGAVRVVMKSFTGQTEENAIIRAAPIVKELQARVQSLQDLVD
jgi:hypothetical protein